MPDTETPSTARLPLLPLRDVVVFPKMVIPLFVGRESSVAAIQAASALEQKEILLVTQHDAHKDDPAVTDLYEIGTLATILQMLKLPDGTLKVLVEGQDRVVFHDIDQGDTEYLTSGFEKLEAPELNKLHNEGLVKTLHEDFEEYVGLSKKIPKEVLSTIEEIDDSGALADTITVHLPIDMAQKQELLELIEPAERVEHLLSVIEAEADLFKVERRIRKRVKVQMEKSQREYYLNEQMKAIQKELGDIDGGGNELDELESKIKDVGMPEAAQEKTIAELNKLKMMSSMSAEASVIRNYIDWMTSVPWSKKSRVRNNLARAEKILEQDHYGLKEVKERILEFLAVQKRVKKLKGPILCLVGPPGVGKTSLGESIARATNRKFVRMSLGGVRDEAEIRGHRRTYIGSMPGRLVQKLSKVEVSNPLFLLDEIDKMGMDFRGDPASALLEVLDPNQNNTFNDHYLEVDYDLSEVLFICTANSMNIPAPLLDRMEVIRIPGYTEDEKVNIALKYLLPQQQKANGLKAGEIEIAEESIRQIIRYYTREAGVRGLDREISKICRKVVTELVKKTVVAPVLVGLDNVVDYLGVKRFDFDVAEAENAIGQVTGLAWTEVGGELLTIEASSMTGSGKVIKTGSLGDVMQESIQAALSVVRARADTLGVSSDFSEKLDLHIHIPAGATPKDGPSAGIAITTAIISQLTDIPVKADVAMTGEITLRGEVLPIGGLKEKLLAAHRGGIKTVLIPEKNRRHISEIPDNIKQSLNIVPVQWIDQVLETALEWVPTPDSDTVASAESAKADESKAKKPRISTH